MVSETLNFYIIIALIEVRQFNIYCSSFLYCVHFLLLLYFVRLVNRCTILSFYFTT